MEVTVKVNYKNDRLKAAREAAGLSQSQLAAAAGVNVRMIQYYEQGSKDFNVAKLATILKVCNALKCRITDVLTDEETISLLLAYNGGRQ